MFSNPVVQIFLGIGFMVFIIMMAESIKATAIRRTDKMNKENEARVKGEYQQEINKLREEIHQLKSTLLEHSMSLESTMDGLKYRIDRLEGGGNEVRNVR